MNKRKILNDPVYGFVSVPTDLIFDLIEHRYFQRLRRIKQLGLTDFVYPGALHTRFHHALGAMHLMSLALRTLKDKGVRITAQEGEAAQIAILLHDIGHGPLSHALEHALFEDVPHEQISLHLMELLNVEFEGRLQLAIDIFRGTYPRPFFHQLVSSQLDMDRLDYLNRDSFYSGVKEGQPGADRLIKMLTVSPDERLVLEEKAVYSIENFLVSRRVMYWQVYMHKAVTSAEQMVIRIMERARDLTRSGVQVPASPELGYFLASPVQMLDFEQDASIIQRFVRLDDVDIWAAVKVWASHPDFVLSFLAHSLLERHLFKITLSSEPLDEDFRLGVIELIAEHFRLPMNEAAQLMIEGRISNNAYDAGGDTINVLTKRGHVIDVAEASDLPNIRSLSKRVEKYYLCYPKEITNM
ncbi:HD domain-containing protein [Solirubrum puertoriconensis]|uniref:Phosphohydrolase n=1 Tax=Solirubrum puertoriconensis TaxID=1751427 RepID=A0A9X0HKJ2_SOLP1|nr:HD domain-containing protein [Solirubrum puertoriconensis]KUG07624.1 phosphohydrolase [Solirubrum puertoriconensis]